MKKIFIITLLFFITNMLAQEKFEYGYYIDNNGNIKEGEISEIKPEKIPSEIYFRSRGKIELKNLNDIKEVKYGNLIFRKKIFKIDSSSVSGINYLPSDSEPHYEEKSDFLQLLLDGEYQLYSYIQSGFQVFFYEKNNENIQTLEYKKYIDAAHMVKENKNYLKQLADGVNNKSYSEKSYSAMKYNSKDLIDYFTMVNGKTNVKEGKAKLSFNFYVGYSYHSFDIDFTPNTNLGTKHYGHITVMPEIEYMLNKNIRNPISFYFNLKYHAFKKEYAVAHESGIWNHSVDYKSIFTSWGVKKYFLTSEKKSFYGKIGLGFNTPFKGDVQSPLRAWTTKLMRIDVAGVGINSGLGIKLYNRFNLEVDYEYTFNSVYTQNNSSLNFKIGYSF